MKSIFFKNVIDILFQKIEQESFIVDDEGNEIRDKKEIKEAIKEFKELLLKDILSREDFKVGFDESEREYTVVTLIGKELWIPRELFHSLVNVLDTGKNGFF